MLFTHTYIHSTYHKRIERERERERERDLQSKKIFFFGEEVREKERVIGDRNEWCCG